MNWLENIWLMATIVLIMVILLQDPKSASSGVSNNQLSMLFNSAPKSQKLLRTFTWLLVFAFFIITIIINLI